MNQLLRLIVVALASVAVASCNQYKDAEEAVRRNMKDPDATQFRDVAACSGDSAVIKGEANGKNSMGAYVGFKPFFYSAGRVSFSEDYDFMQMMDRCYSNLKSSALSSETAEDVEGAALKAAADASAAASAAAEASEKLSKVSASKVGEPQIADAEPVGERCWQDYCPCDISDPDYGGADTVICRNLKGGLPVDDQMMSSGAGLRDARRQLREFEESN